MSASHSTQAEHLSLQCLIVTCSDSRTLETDESGRWIAQALKQAHHHVADHVLIPDSPDAIREVLKQRVDVDVVLINGGTGIARRDNTFDTISALIDKPMPGFGEIFRVLSYEEIGAAAMLSRAMAGVVGSRLVFSMPGSRGAVRLAMEKLILPDLKHLVWEIRKPA